MNGVADNAVGAILEIPDTLLTKIKTAEDKIKSLGETSERVAKEVSNHWGTIAPDGLQKFIDKIAEAKAKMDGLGTINVTLNTQAAVQSTEQLSSTTQKTSADVSKAVQDMAQSYDVLAKVDISGVRKIAEDEVMSIEKIKAKIKELEAELKIANVVSSEGVLNPNIQKIADEKKAWEEYIRIITEASRIKEKALGAVVAKNDKVYLDEQKRLLAEILDLRKQVNGQKIVVAQGQVTGSSTLEQDKKILSDLIARLYEAKDRLKEYNAEKYKNVSAEGQAKAQVNVLNQENALIKEQMSFREKLNSAIARGNELTAQTQASKARLGSSDEAVAQRQLNSDYKEMLKIIKEKGEIQAKAAEQGRALNQQEIALITALDSRYRTFESDIQRVSSSYTKMAEASARQFASDKSDQLARNAVALADAQNKAAEAAQKVADAQAKAAQQQASKDRSQAESDLNRLYTERLRLLKEKEQLENKALVNTAKGLPDLTAKENQLLAEVTAKIATIENQISTIGQSYAGLAAKTKHAFAIDELRQATDLQNQFNAAISSIDTNKTKQLVAEYKRLYAENEKLIAAIDQYNSKIAGTRPIGDVTSTTSAVNNIATRQAEVARQMAEIERKNIQEVADFRQQKEMEANQRSISEFIQAEAQKKAEAQKTVNEQIAQARQAGQQYAQSFAGAMAQYNQMMSGRAGGNLVMSLENVKRVLNDLKTAAGKLNILNPADEAKAKQLKDAIENLNKVVKQYKQVTDSSTSKPVISSQDALNMAKSATTLRQLETAYKALKSAMSATDPTSTKWAAMNTQLQQTKTHIDEIKKKMGEFQKQTAQTSSLMGQLQGRIAAAFSVGAIGGFLKKVTEVRAQFELQRVALGAIIQDRDEANKIFTQVQNMALESPFSIMQLERATKQIAAFGFEAKKLVPTMKMFADISAGLGVEIDRLVLVMGHLKARNFLEGTMVRQFTNMGFNVLGELSKYYSELENRMVSVAEVQDRVKKKMISFEDVEEVLKRVTSAGGMFYDMQKKQSDSIWGQMQRIKDAYDLMLNEIGQSNEGTIKMVLSSIRSLINSWRSLKPYIVAAVAAMSSYMAVAVGWKMISTLITGSRIAIILFTKGLQAAKAAQQSLNITMSANPYAAVAAAVVALGTYLYQVATATSKLEEEMERIGSDLTDSLNESIATFKQLADTISDSNSTYTERTEAMTELRRVYADILPQEKMEIAYIQSLHGNYAELTKAIQKYYQEKEYNQKMEVIQGSNEAKALQTQWEETLTEMNERGLFDLKYSRAQIKSWAETLSKEMTSGKLNASVESLDKRIKDIFNAKDLSKYWKDVGGTADIQDILQAYQKLEDVQGSIYLNTLNAENAFASYSEQIKHLDVSGLESLSKGLNEQREEVEKKIQDFKNEKYVYIEELGRAANIRYEPDAIDYLNEQLKQTETQLKAVQEAEEQWLANQFKEEVSKLNNELTAQYKAYWDLSREMESLRQNGKLTKSEIDRLSTAMKQAEESAENARKKFGLGEEYSISKGFLDSADTSYELQQKLDTLATKAFPKVAEFAMKAMNNLSKAILQGKISVFGFLKDVADALPDFVKESIPGLNGILSKVDERLKLSEQQLAELGNAANEASEKAKNTERSFDEIVSPIMERRVGQFGADLKEIDDILVHSDKTGDGAAKSLRARAKSWDELVKAYNTVPDKNIWLELNHQTKESMEMMEKNSKAAKQLAIDLAGEDKKEKAKRGARGKDPWQERLSLFKELNTEYEKLLKNYSAEESKQRIQLSYARAVAEIFAGQGKFGNIENWIGFDKKSMIEIGKEMIASLNISEEKRKDLLKQISGLKAEVDVHIQEDAVKDFEKHMQEVADNLELSDVFRKLGVPIDIVYTLGGKPTTLEDQRKELEDNYYEIFKVQKKYGEEGEKAYDKIQQAIAKKEQKNLEERAKNYIKYLTESMGERAQIEINAMRDINKIEEDMTLDNFSKQQAKMQRRKKMQEDLAKFDLGELKGSDVYLSVFKDLENASKEQLQYVINKFKELQSTFKNLSPAQVKSIASEIKKMEDALAGKDSVKNMFANLRDSIKYARQRNNLLREQTKIQDDIDSRSKMLSRAEKYLTELELNRKGIQDESSEAWQEANEKVLAQQEFVKKLQDEIESLRKKLGLVTESISKGEQAWQGWKQGISNIRNGMGQVRDSVDAVFSGLDSMGLVNDAFRDTYESIGEIMGGLDTFMGGLESINIMKPFSIITGSIKAIGGVFQTIGGFFGIGDKKKERSIQRLADKVDALDKAYQKLEKSIEAAYTFSDYNAGYKQMQDNLEAQKKSYEEMIALEESKKKTDKDKVKEYNEKLEEIAEKQKDLRKERIEAMGSTTDYLNEAQSFVDAWLDAYKETGSGLDALGDKWEEFVENLFVKQGAAQIVSSRLKGIIDTINTAIEAGATDFNLADVVNKAREEWKKEAEIIEPLLEQLFGSYGLGKGNGDFILSDLQKGIQNITEPQAAAIEAYLNSMRFAVFRHTEQLDTLIATIQAQYGSGTENPVVTELKGIRGVLDNIDRRLASVINTQGRNATLRIGT